MKTRLKNRIAGFSREQLIDWICLSCVDIRSTHSAEDAQDMINDIREAIEVGFPAALTAQPVKLPKGFSPGIGDLFDKEAPVMRRDSEGGKWLHKAVVAQILNELGYEVQE